MAVVFYQDGSSRLVPLTRLERIGLLEKLTRERYRKFLEDNLPNPTNAHIVKDLARFVARENDVFKSNDGNANPPVLVMLIDYFAEVPPIHENKPTPRHFKVKFLCSYPVTPGDLK